MVGKLLVAVCCTAIAVVIINYFALCSSLYVPCALVFIFSLIVAHVFMEQLGVCVDAIFLCYLVDFADASTIEGNIAFGTKSLQRLNKKVISSVKNAQEYEVLPPRDNAKVDDYIPDQISPTTSDDEKADE